MAESGEYWEDPELQAAVDYLQRSLHVTAAFYDADAKKYKIQHSTFHPLVCANPVPMMVFQQSRRLSSSHAEPIFPTKVTASPYPRILIDLKVSGS